MFITSTDGRRLERSSGPAPDVRRRERGFVPEDYELRYDHITELRGDGFATL
jgi:hypothetical protein